MKKLIIYSILFTTHLVSAQNLIRNGDFEEYLKSNHVTQTPTSPDTTISKYTRYWASLYGFNIYINNKLSFADFPSDIEHLRYIKPFRNNAFINVLQTYWYTIGKDSLAIKCPFAYTQVYCRGYGGIYQKLASPLKVDTSYILSYRFKIGDSTRIPGMEKNPPVNILSNFGVRFSKHDTFIYLLPDSIPHRAELQDTILDTSYKWRLIERTFKADSAYTSAAFTQFSLKSLKYRLYYVDTTGSTGIPNVYGVDFETYIDDIRLLPQWQYLKVSNDTTICSGSTVNLRVMNGSGPYKWRLASKPSSILSTTSSLSIKVDTTSMYQVMSPYDTASIMVYVTKPTYDSISMVSCGKYLWRGKWLSAAGVYKDTSISAGGCKFYYTLNFKRTLNNKVTKLDSTELKADQDSVSYQWYYCNPWTKLNGDTSSRLKGTKGKSYTVVLNNGKGCVDTSACISINGSSIVSEVKIDWRVFPNPLVDELTIELDRLYSHISAKVYDVSGKLMIDKTLKNNTRFTISVINIPHGSYYLILEADGKSQFYNLKK